MSGDSRVLATQMWMRSLFRISRCPAVSGALVEGVGLGLTALFLSNVAEDGRSPIKLIGVHSAFCSALLQSQIHDQRRRSQEPGGLKPAPTQACKTAHDCAQTVHYPWAAGVGGAEELA